MNGKSLLRQKSRSAIPITISSKIIEPKKGVDFSHYRNVARQCLIPNFTGVAFCRLPLGHEPLGLEPFDELRVSSSVEKLGAERLEAEWLR
jgi:hypothetical protein